jgi:hypothetical protein
MKVSPFNSINEAKNPIEDRVYHNNSDCQAWYQIPDNEKRQGDAGYRLCIRCKNLNKKTR